MDRDLLVHLPILEAVARRGGFAAAAAELGLSPSSVTHAVQAVERRLGQPVLIRTTRKVTLTDVGAQLIARLSPALAEITESLEAARSTPDAPAGHLRINTPRVAVSMALAPIIALMAVRHPKVTIELIVEDALSDIVAEGHDAGVRLGEMIAADMIAVRLTPPIKAILCAAPSYLASRKIPASLADLDAHNLIGLRFSPNRALYDWDVRDGKTDVTIRTSGNAIVPDPLSALDLALAGVGIAYLYEPIVRSDLAHGRLVEVLPDAAMEEPGLFLYFPRLASSAPKLRAFLDTARLVRGSQRHPEIRAAT